MTSDRFFIDKRNLESRYVYLEGEEHHHLSRLDFLLEEREEEKKLLLSENRGKYLRDVLRAALSSIALIANFWNL